MSTALDHKAFIQKRSAQPLTRTNPDGPVAASSLDPDAQAYAIFDRGAFTREGVKRYGLLMVEITNLDRENDAVVRVQDSPDNDAAEEGYTDLATVMLSDLSTTGETLTVVGGGRVEAIIPVTTDRFIKFSAPADGTDNAVGFVPNLAVRVIHFTGTIDIVNRVLND